ncbi:sigma-54-dependent transcriptional regulator [Pacificimonas flava]|nr:sigma-54 dependent transcriptional regulator [Pacificimonas flava]MBB5278987.1 DNA-binding NtrC family response regulator [Pacificimonas flava]
MYESEQMKGEFGACLVVDDDEDILFAAQLLLRQVFQRVETVTNPAAAMAVLAAQTVDVVLLDANFTRGATNSAEGMTVLQKILDTDPHLAVVMMTAHAGVNVAVEAMKRGASDFVSKPWSNDRLLAAARTAAALSRSRRGSPPMPGAAESSGQAARVSPLIGTSPAMTRVHSLIARAAPTDANVLILGENGTGKELAARDLHEQSRRANGPMVTVDLGALSAELIDSELFGHVKGAFTDAKANRVGRIQAADGGTLFLDEIGNLPLHLQPKLLTALEQRHVTPVGANRPVPVDVRVIAATNMTYAMLRDERHFRQDLLFRLNTVEIEVPSLRERPEDIPALLQHFLVQYAKRYAKPVPTLSPAARQALLDQDWPGNVRALRHAAERAIILGGEELSPEDFPAGHAAEGSAPATLRPDHSGPDLNLDRAERRLVEAALKKHGYNISSSAAELGLSRAALYRRMEKHGL